jgi:hypothetical protein
LDCELGLAWTFGIQPGALPVIKPAAKARGMVLSRERRLGINGNQGF